MYGLFTRHQKAGWAPHSKGSTIISLCWLCSGSYSSPPRIMVGMRSLVGAINVYNGKQIHAVKTGCNLWFNQWRTQTFFKGLSGGDFDTFSLPKIMVSRSMQ